jgi:hypothetical protein
VSIFKVHNLELLDINNKKISTNGVLKIYKKITRKTEILVVIKEISGDIYEIEKGRGGKREMVKFL